MTYGQVNGVGKPVARIVHGTTMLSTDALEEGVDLLDGVFAAGGATFDSAWNYGGGECERVLGAWMERRGNREQVVILTKGCHHNQDRDRVTPADLTSDLMDSLVRLRTDYVDLYLLHRDDPSTPGRRDRGDDGRAPRGRPHPRLRRLQLERAADRGGERLRGPPRVAGVRGEQSQLQPGRAAPALRGRAACRSAARRRPSDRDWYRRTQLPVFSWSSLAGGFFSGPLRPRHTPGRTPAGRRCPPPPTARTATSPAWKRRRRSAAITACRPRASRWPTSCRPASTCTRSPPRRPRSEFADNAAALELELSVQDIERLQEAESGVGSSHP